MIKYAFSQGVEEAIDVCTLIAAESIGLILIVPI